MLPWRLRGDSALRELALPESGVTAAFLVTIVENHAPGLRTFRHKGVTENKHLHFKDLEHKIMHNELRAIHGNIQDLGKLSLSVYYVLS